MRWHTKPIMQLAIMLVVMSVVIGAQNTASALLTHNTKNSSVAQGENTELRKVAGGMADPTCPNTDPVQYALTENNLAIAPPKRMRYVDAPWEYDTLNTNYFSRTDLESEFTAAGNIGTKAENLTFMADDPNDDPKVTSIMSSMFRYKPTVFKNTYVLKYSGAPRGNDTPHKGDAPAIEVPSKAGWPVCVPTTGYDIGGGYEAMVVSAESNRITLHIGIHEYMVGQDPALGGCPPGQQCRGGYWLYISGIAVDSDILSAYNGKKGIQQGSGLSRNIIDRIQLPIVKPGRRLGTSQGDGVIVLLRDSGPIIYANKNFMWGGGFPEYNPGTTLTATPPAAATATPPTAGTTATPMPPTGTPAPGSIPVTFRLINQGDGNANLNCLLHGELSLENATDPTFNPTFIGADVTRINVGEYTDIFAQTPPGIYYYHASFNQGPNLLGNSPPGNNNVVTIRVSQPIEVIPVSTSLSTNPYYQQCIGNSSSPTPTTTVTPTLPAGGAPSPTIVVGGNRLALVFAGSCDSNPLCGHLKALTRRDFNSLDGLIWINGAMSVGDYRLGEHIRYTQIVGRDTTEHRFTLTMHAGLPPLSSWHDATMDLPGAAGSAYVSRQAYAIK